MRSPIFFYKLAMRVGMPMDLEKMVALASNTPYELTSSEQRNRRTSLLADGISDGCNLSQL